MMLSDKHVEYIATNLEFYGVTSDELKEDLLDHICTQIETSNHNDFEAAYKDTMQKFGGHHAMSTIQRETNSMITIKNKIRSKRLIYISGYIATTLISTGWFFKIMHWPFAGILLALGFAILIILFFPTFFYNKYKSSERKLYE